MEVTKFLDIGYTVVTSNIVVFSRMIFKDMEFASSIRTLGSLFDMCTAHNGAKIV